MSHACVGMLETSGKTLRMPTQAWDMAPNVILEDRNNIEYPLAE